MKRVMGAILVGALSISLVFSASANIIKNAVEGSVIKPVFTLDHIKLINQQEADGDELYVTLSVRSKDKPTVYTRTPEKPEHWLSKLIAKVQKVQLWSEPLAEGDSVILFLELNEEDSMILNPDDLIGLVEVKLTNKQGQLQAEWAMPNRTTFPMKVVGARGDIQKFDLQQDNAHYEIYLSVNK